MRETILITGANRGIGLELARSFADRGWRVLACCRSPQKAAELAELADRYPKQVDIQRLEVTDAGQLKALSETLKGEPIDILFNNAGVSGPKKQDFGETDPTEWLEVLRVNVVAPLKVSEALVDQVAGSRRKIIAVMGSQLGSIADNGSGGMYAYRSSKTAVHQVAKCMAVDLKERGITVVVFHPGWVRTSMGGPQAPTQPAESAAGLTRVLLTLTPEQSGHFLSWEGKELPW